MCIRDRDNVDDISFNFFNAEDVVRHPVVARIVRAYEHYDAQQERVRKEKKEEALRLQREQADANASSNSSSKSSSAQQNSDNQ